MIDAAALRVVVQGDTSPAERSLRSFSSTLNNAARSMGMTGALMSAGITLPILAASKGLFTLGTGFESAFTGVIKTVNATADQIAALRSGILAMSQQLPTSANQIAGVAEAAGQLGIATENILGFTRVMVELGDTTNLSAQDAATSLARFANITGMAQTDFDRLGSVIVALGNNFATTESEIVAMAMRLAGAGHQVGMTEADIMGLAAALSSVGIDAEAGGTAISRVMVDMAQAVSQGGVKLTDFAGVAGMSAEAFAKAFRDDAAGALVTFIEGLGNLSASGADVFSVLDELGLSDIRVRDALLRAAGASDMFRGALDLASKAWQENTALTHEAELRYATTASRLDVMTNKLRVLGIAGFDALQPSINAGIQKIGEFATQMTGLIPGLSTLNPNLVKAALAFTGVWVAAGPVIAILGGVAGAIGFLATPVGAIVLATAALAAAWAADFGGIREITQGVIAAVRPGFQELLGWIEQASQGNFTPLKAGLQGALTSVQATIQTFKWADYIQPMKDWSAYITALDWKQIITTTIDWGMWITTLPWNTFVKLLDWSVFLSALSWNEWIGKIDWGQWVSHVDWGAFVVRLDDWAKFVGRVAWNDLIKNLEWPQFIKALNWSDFVTVMSDWGVYITALDWNTIGLTLLDWSTWIPALEWNAHVAILDWATYVGFVAWQDYIVPLDWATVVTGLTDWNPWITALVWEPWIAPLEWSAYVFTLDWSTILPTLNAWTDYIVPIAWSDFVEKINWPVLVTAVDWSQVIPPLSWSDIVPPFSWSDWIPGLDWGNWAEPIDWATFIVLLPWEFYVAPLQWAAFVFDLRWDDWVPDVTWTDFVPNINWSSFIPHISWGDFVPDLSWSSWISSINWSSFVPTVQWPSVDSILSAIASIVAGGILGSGGVPAAPVTPGSGSSGPGGFNAAGTSYWRGGPTWVGERGPELVSLPRGSRIYSHDESMAPAGAGGITVNVNVAGIASDLDIEALGYKLAKLIDRKGRGR